MTISLISSIFVTALGFLYSISALTLPAAAMGRPNEPKIFPLMLGILLVILGLVLIYQEIKEVKSIETSDSKHKINFGTSEKQIALTILNGVIYSLLFNPIGYVISTILFLMAELLIFSGFKTWKKSLLVAVIFSVTAYLIFDVLLGIYLPKSPLGLI